MEENTFYNAFDVATQTEGYPRPDDYRTPFQIDRDRILHTSAFRRLQSKTQVFLAGEYDIYRTRLTHSLEVAQIGRSICHRLRKRSSCLGEGFYIDPDLVEAACLAHDLGHPPFGHSGERTLHRLMQDLGGFEGNAQTLRLLTEAIYRNPLEGTQRGMNPTRAFIDGVLKYKALLSEVPRAFNHFLYDDQELWLAFVFDDEWDRTKVTFAPSERNQLRSIECQIMDWADDTAYCLNDLVDGIHVGFITIEKIERWASNQTLGLDEEAHLAKLLTTIREQRTEPSLGRKIGDFIAACEVAEESNPSPMAKQTNRYRFRLSISPAIKAEASLYKRLAHQVVFQSPELQQLDHKGDLILRKLFAVFGRHYLRHLSGGDEPGEGHSLRLLPEPVERMLNAEAGELGRARLVCDHLASMTDGFATRTFKRLFDPDFGSIMDLV